MKYYIVMYTEEEELEIVDNSGSVLYFPSEDTAISFWGNSSQDLLMMTCLMQIS